MITNSSSSQINQLKIKLILFTLFNKYSPYTHTYNQNISTLKNLFYKKKTIPLLTLKFLK